MNYTEFENCGLKRCLNMLSGKWKPIILFHLFNKKELRFIQLWQMIPRVSKKVLLDQLSQLDQDNLVKKTVIKGFPPKVFYKIHDDAKELGALLKALNDFGNKHF